MTDLELLVEIRDKAREVGACVGQFVPFCAALDSGDYLTAWQTVLGNYGWLEDHSIQLPVDLEERADGLGKVWGRGGRLAAEFSFKDGQMNGLCRSWHFNGQLCEEYTREDGEFVGRYRYWFDNGQLERELTHENGKLHGLLRVWHDNGQLAREATYDRGSACGPGRRWDRNGQLFEKPIG